MPLSAYQPRRETIAFSGGSAEFRGLATNDVARLFELQRGGLDTVGAILAAAAENSLQSTIVTLITDAPQFVANLIALASDYGESDADLAAAIRGAQSLPIALQVKALEVIAKLTFDEVGGILPFMQSLAAILSRMVPSGQAQTALRGILTA